MKTSSSLKIVLLFFITIVLNSFLKSYGGTVVTITYQSTTQNTSCKMNIYLPTGYDQASDSLNKYPVFYLIHGGGENYTHWVSSGNAKYTLDEFIAAGKSVPMILVMPDAKNLAADVFANELLNDIIPYIEKNYRVKADKDHRGVGGLSWGGLQAMEAGIYHYEKFGYLSVLSSGWFTSETATYNRARNFLSAHGKEMENSIRYLYFGEGTFTDIAYENGLATMNVLRDSGLTVHYWEHPGGHSWSAWQEDLKSFLPFLFRDSTTRYVSLEFLGGKITRSTIMTQLDSVIAAPLTPTRTGYSFAGWFKQAACIDSFNFSKDTIKKNITIYAKWKANSCKVSFNSNGGSVVTDTLVADYNSLITAPAEPAKQGFTFDGWYTSEAFTKKWNFSTDKLSANMILVAKWIDNATVQIAQDDEMKISIFPNPAHSVLQISNLPTNASIALFSLEGKLMIGKNMEAPSGSLNIEALPQGVYNIKILTKFSELNKKVIVKH